MDDYSSTPIESGFIIFTGVFNYSDEFHYLIRSGKEKRHFDPALNFPGMADSFKLYSKLFYTNFTNQIISQKVFDENAGEEWVHHYRHKHPEQYTGLRLQGTEQSFIFNILRLDLFLFREKISIKSGANMGLFAIMTSLPGQQDTDLSKITSFTSCFRDMSTMNQLDYDGRKYSIPEFIEEHFLEKNCLLNETVNRIQGTKLKAYSVISVPQETELSDAMLFDIGTCSPPGTSLGGKPYSPGKEYLEEVVKENKVACFEGWKALSLFDNFTVIGHRITSHSLNLEWGETRFFIYAYCLKQKYYLFSINSDLSDMDVLKHRIKKLRDSFTEFINMNELDVISNNFLPNILYKKIRQSFDIPDELKSLEKKIETINVLTRENSARKMTGILTLLTILSIASTIKDSTDLIDGFLYHYRLECIFHTGSLVMGIAAGFLLLYILLLKFRT